MGDSYRDLIAWRKGISLVARIYESTREFPRDKLYGLSQKCAVSRAGRGVWRRQRHNHLRGNDLTGVRRAQPQPRGFLET
jgi:23S rRNA-intervening sequence protein